MAEGGTPFPGIERKMTLGQSNLLRIEGIPTFLRAPQGGPEDLKEGMMAVAGVPYDLSCTSRIGARFAPRAIRQESDYYGGYFSGGDLVEMVSATGQRFAAWLVVRFISENVLPGA